MAQIVRFGVSGPRGMVKTISLVTLFYIITVIARGPDKTKKKILLVKPG